MTRRVGVTFEPESPPARCAVCGGPETDGNGCEFCPAVVHVTDCTCGQQGICTRCVIASLERG